jgi:hypothetical protein
VFNLSTDHVQPKVLCLSFPTQSSTCCFERQDLYSPLKRFAGPSVGLSLVQAASSRLWNRATIDEKLSISHVPVLLVLDCILFVRTSWSHHNCSPSQNTGVLCSNRTRGMEIFLRCCPAYVAAFRWGTSPPLWSSGQSSWLQLQRSLLDSRRYHIFWEVVGLERGPLSLLNTIEELFEIKSSGSGLECREYRRRYPSRWPHGTVYSQMLALTWPTSGYRSICTFRLRTQATELRFRIFFSMGYIFHS